MYIERIKFERTGGFAGIRIAAEIELNSLDEDQKKQILNLIDELDIDELPEKLGAKMPVPDEFVYSIVVESETREYKVLTGQSALPDEMVSLIEILERIAKRKMRSKD